MTQTKTNSLTDSLSFMRDRLYLAAYPIIRPLVGQNKRGSEVRFSAVRPNLFQATDTGLGRIFFYTVKRARLYFTPQGIEGRVKVVGDKYQTDGCRVEQGDTVFDIGANIGEFSISIRDTAAKVYSFEPDPVARAAPEANQAHFKTFTVVPWAMGETPGELTFYLSSDGADSSIIVPDSYTDVITVKSETIDNAITQFGLEKVDFLKLEAEGFEPEILKGAGASLAKIRKIAIDVSPERQGQSPAKEVLAILEEAGFEAWQDKNVVFARRP